MSIELPVKRNLSRVRQENVDISVVIPIYNEEENLPHLEQQLYATLDTLDQRIEVIAVNDGSSDRSADILADIVSRHDNFRVVNFRRNYGQTAAMMAGIDYSSGDIIITIDSDLQNDPKDIPALLKKMDEGNDVVSGWRKDRKDSKIKRNFVSRLANRLISKISGVHLHDYGCTLKAYRREVMQGQRLYGEMHRFIPIYASWMGAKVVEIPVRHHARRFGQSKYGLERTLKVVLDLIVIKFLDSYLVKPIYVFGGFGLFTLFISGVSFFAMLYLKFVSGVSFILTPLPLLSAMSFLIGIISILMGLLAEIMVRTYFESQERAAYTVGNTVNFPVKDK